jgi:hypothetical protein
VQFAQGAEVNGLELGCDGSSHNLVSAMSGRMTGFLGQIWYAAGTFTTSINL